MSSYGKPMLLELPYRITVLPATRHRWMCPTLTPTSKLVLDLPTLEGWKAELTTQQCANRELKTRSFAHESDATLPSQLHTAQDNMSLLISNQHQHWQYPKSVSHTHILDLCLKYSIMSHKLNFGDCCGNTFCRLMLFCHHPNSVKILQDQNCVTRLSKKYIQNLHIHVNKLNK